MIKKTSVIFCSFLVFFTLAGCSELGKQENIQHNTEKEKPIISKDSSTAKSPSTDIVETKKTVANTTPEKKEPEKTEPPQPNKTQIKVPPKKTVPENKKGAIQVVAKPEAIPVLVNKKNKLPESYIPKDLVYTTIPFIFKERTEKRKMRSEAATAIAQLFEGAKKDGVNLLGVSAYRSHATQTSLFNYYVKKDGYEKARTYSALPGTSEHETGLSIDVTGGNGKCAAKDCFGGTIEATWLQSHAAEYGFIIRYPRGKDAITGYKYEPWHLRYVGNVISKEIMGKGITLEEYYNTIPVSN